MQRAQIEWTKKRQERLDYINNEIVNESKAVKRFKDLNSVMQHYFEVTGRQLEPFPPLQTSPFRFLRTMHLKIITIEN